MFGVDKVGAGQRTRSAAATLDYRRESDQVGRFIQERLPQRKTVPGFGKRAVRPVP